MLSLKFVKTECGSTWHWLHDGALQCSSPVTTDPTQERSVEISKLMPQINRINRVLDGKRPTRGALAKALAPELYLDEGELRVCRSCLPSLFEFLAAKTTMKEEPTISIDPTKPIVVRAHSGLLHSNPLQFEQAEGKTIEAAKELARKITEEEGISATVMVPHTTYERPTSPIKEIMHKPT